jgi:hypothetical protein
MPDQPSNVLDYETAAGVSARPSPRWRWRLVRLGVVIAGLALWFFTQYLIGQKSFPKDRIGDGLFDLTAPVHAYLLGHPRSADSLLIASSLLIDFLGLFVIGYSIIGPSVRPFVGLIVLFGLRQVCQGVCALPPPEGMIWRDPGFPTLLVTYGVGNDLFFSGHTALAVYGSVTLAQAGGGRRGLGVALVILGVAIAVFEAAAVILLRAHYTMDVFAGAVTALLVVLMMRVGARRPASIDFEGGAT